MSLRPHLILQPIHNSTADILKCFTLGTPLTCEQINFIAWHQQQLSSPEFDLIYKYYIESAKKKQKASASFLLSSGEPTPQSIKQLKSRINLFLQNKSSHLHISLTQDQFLKFRALSINELIFWHGNQFLNGTSFIPGGIPPVIYFRWGNLFGVLLYVFSAGRKELNPKVLLYFEDTLERNLDQCVADYQKTLKNELNLQQNILNDNKIESSSFDHFIIKPPILTPNPNNLRK